jgi:hemerythrin superfamily protein
VLGLSELADRVGLDLLTFQDHPYQPRFFDTWTLLSYVAARTPRIRLSANVINLPMRPPTVLARSAASLDILSGGRVELALGAGAFWDAIEAMGGPRRSPAEAVEALDEAIQIIRATWDPDTPGGVRVRGKHYRVNGAKRGPKPPHDIGIWLGAYKPRMQRLIGRVADGWLPSVPYLKPGQLAEGNAIIDQAAAEAGRSPRDIRRLLNLGDDISIEELTELAHGDGISGFLLTTGDPRAIQQFAEEIAPAVRELVDKERSTAVAPAASVAVTTQPVGLDVDPTPDDGVRIGRSMPWDESTRPSRPIPTDDVAYSDRGRSNAQHLIDIHNHFRSELAQIRELIDQVLGAYCASYCRVLTQHHTLEDRALFPYLRSRDPALGPVLDRLGEEHHAIHGVLEQIDRSLVSNLTEPDDLAALGAAVDTLTDSLLSHLAYEEHELVEPIARYEFGV